MMVVSKWVKSLTYKPELIEPKGIPAFVTFVETARKGVSVFHVYRVVPLWGDMFYGVVFGDQVGLQGYADKNKDNLLSVRLLKEDSIMHEYGVWLESLREKVKVKTIGHLCTILRKPVVREEV